MTVAGSAATTPASARAGNPEDRASANAWTASSRRCSIVGRRGEDDTEFTLTRVRARRRAARRAHGHRGARRSAAATVILQNTGAAHLAENVEIVLGDGADLTVVTVQEWDDDALHVASPLRRRSAADARLKHVVVTLGGGVVRVNPSVAPRRRRRATPSCSAPTSPTPASTSSSRSTSSTTRRTPAAA